MQDNQLIIKEKEKQLKHVKVYDRLYEGIQNGTYPIGSQLPSEPDLAVQMDVSRMTLRRALALLQEDALIKNIRGKGNFVLDHTKGFITSNLQHLVHPISFCCDEPWNDIELVFRIEPTTDSIAQVLEGRPTAVIIADRWYKNKETGQAVSYTLSFIAIEAIADYHVDLNKNEEVITFLENTVYLNAAKSSTLFSHTTTGNYTSTKYILSEIDSFIIIQETIYDKEHRVLISNKHYIPVESFKMQVSADKHVEL